tara:strand:+ start:741 stop:881 length:141 start_codon:yes stop_codon:yes gene_type:complete
VINRSGILLIFLLSLFSCGGGGGNTFDPNNPNAFDACKFDTCEFAN